MKKFFEKNFKFFESKNFLKFFEVFSNWYVIQFAYVESQLATRFLTDQLGNQAPSRLKNRDFKEIY